MRTRFRLKVMEVCAGTPTRSTSTDLRTTSPTPSRWCTGRAARLEISEPPARCRCRDCAAEFEPDGP